VIKNMHNNYTDLGVSLPPPKLALCEILCEEREERQHIPEGSVDTNMLLEIV
jgi:hypothetical protein